MPNMADCYDFKQYYMYLSIIATSDYVLAIRGVCQTGHVVEVTLLLQDIGLTLPLPDQQLTQPCTP